MMVGLMAFYIVPRLVGIIILLGLMELVAWASYKLGIWPVGVLFRVLEWVVIIGAVVWMWNYIMNLLKSHKAMQEMKMRPPHGGAASEAMSESQLTSEKDAAISLIQHLQKMLAYQQLSMERYNDAAALASGSPLVSGMVVARPLFSVQSRTLVSQYMIPALEYKIELIRSMKDQHEQVGQLVPEKIRRPYDEMSAAINMMLERANLQYQGFTSLVQNSDSGVDMTRLDQAESAAVTRAVQSLNGLIERVGLTVPSSDEWMKINCQAFNEVRGVVGLSPIEEETFRIKYLEGLSGGYVRFFE